jgi:hypothetical protein
VTSPTVLPPAPLSPEGPASPERVLSWIKVQDKAAAAEAGEVDAVVLAVNAVLRRWVPVPAEGQPWPDDVALGSVMLAGRLWRRRNTPGGVESFGQEGAFYVQRNDPDVALLLGLGAYVQPMVG